MNFIQTKITNKNINFKPDIAVKKIHADTDAEN